MSATSGIFLVAATAVFISCSTSYMVVPYQEQAQNPRRYSHDQLLETLEDSKAEIMLKTGWSGFGSEFSIRRDSLVWFSTAEGNHLGARLSEIAAVVTKNRLQGGIKGFLLGALGGVGVGALVASGSSADKREFGGLFEGLIVGSLVAVGGAVAGVIIGHRDEYVFVLDSVKVDE